MITTSASPRSSAGPDRAGPVKPIIIGTIPEISAIAFAALPHPERAGTPSEIDAPEVARIISNGIPLLLANFAALTIFGPSSSLRAPRWGPGFENTATTFLPSISVIDNRVEPGTLFNNPSIEDGLELGLSALIVKSYP